ncbi:hypothetical protein DSECCO2_505100 [anaerobic digester metagenome]
MGDPVEVGNLPGKDLATPDRGVVPVAHAVDRDPDTLLPGRRSDVRPVVLDCEEFRPDRLGNLPRVAGREELRVEVVDDQVISRPDKSPDLLRRLLQVGEGLGVSDVSHMGRGDAEARFVDGDVRVQLRPDAEDTRISEVDRRPFRGEAP